MNMIFIPDTNGAKQKSQYNGKKKLKIPISNC